MRATTWMAAGLAVALAAGCGGGSDQSPPAPAADQPAGGGQTAAGADQVAQGLQQMAQGLQQLGQNAQTPVDYESLKAALPDVGGWTKSNVSGRQMSMPVSFSNAEATYTKGEMELDLEITDTALSQILLAPMSMFLASGFEERSDDGYKRSTRIGGSPAFEEWSRAGHGEVTAVVANRFIVTAKGRNVESLDPVRALVAAVDQAKLSGLK